MGTIHDAMHLVSEAIGVAGVLVLVYGVGVGLVMFVRVEAGRFRGDEARHDRGELRKAVAYYILLALELLIAKDIIETIIKPDLDSLLILGVIVVIRTVISFSLSWELREGKDTPA